jgi:hypothetical protein
MHEKRAKSLPVKSTFVLIDCAMEAIGTQEHHELD